MLQVNAAQEPEAGTMITAMRRVLFATVSAVGLAACGSRDPAGSSLSVTMVPDKTWVNSGQSVTLTWTSQHANSCIATGSWTGERPPAGSAESGPLDAPSSTFELTCVQRGRSARASVVVTVGEKVEMGLDFPGSAATEGTVRFRFTRPLAIYPATYIWKVYPRSQPHYYTAFFWGNDGEFGWDKIGRAHV